MAEQKQISQLLEETTITETMNIPTEDTSLAEPLTRRISLSSLKTFLLDGISSAWSGITGKPFNSIDTNTLNVDESNVLSVKADVYASKDSVDNHIDDNEIHITEIERTSWNEKLSIDDIAEGIGISLDKDIDSNKITISSLATINPNKILGEYNTVLELETAYPDGGNLDGGFLIGTENPKEYYYWSTTEIPNSWQSAGTLQGEKGIDGKSAYEIAVEKGFVGTEAEWFASLKGENGINGLTVSVNNVEQVDGDITLTSSGIPVENENFIATDVNGALDELFASVSNGKTLIASAITDKGVTTLATDTFDTMADKIGEIESGGEQLGIYPIGTDGRPTGDVVVPSGVTSLYRYLFDSNKNVITVQLPDGLINIDTQAFNQCKSLASITIPNSVTSIGSGAFYSCSKPSSIIIPSSVTSIGSSAFAYCTSLASVDIKTLICTFVFNTFQGSTALTDFITYPNFDPTTLNLSYSSALSVTSITTMFTNLVDLTGQTAKTITLGATNLAKLTTEQKAIATAKNWTLA